MVAAHPGLELVVAASESVSASGALGGLEQTPAAGKRAALWQAVLASHVASRPVDVLIGR